MGMEDNGPEQIENTEAETKRIMGERVVALMKEVNEATFKAGILELEATIEAMRAGPEKFNVRKYSE